MRNIDDAIFGKLIRRGHASWRGTVKSPVFGTMGLVLGAQGQEPSKRQQACFLLYLKNEPSIFQDAERVLFSVYQRVMARYRVAPALYIGENVPTIANQSEIWKLLERPFQDGTTLYISEQRAHVLVAHLCWNCVWDFEHGIEVQIEDGVVVGPGPR